MKNVIKNLLLMGLILSAGICQGTGFIGFNTYKLSTAPGTGVNPPTGYIHSWVTLDGSDNLLIHYRLADGTDKTFSFSLTTLFASPTFTGTVSGISKAMVGLGYVDNTADAVKNVLYAATAGSAPASDVYS